MTAAGALPALDVPGLVPNSPAVDRRGVTGNLSNGYFHATLGGLRPRQMSPRSIRPQDSPVASYQTGLVSNSMQNGLFSDRASTG